MVEKLIAMAKVSWETLIFALSLLAATSTFAIRLGSTETHVGINTERLNILETEHKEFQRSMSQLQATQSEMIRQLYTIKSHDVETRNIETKIMERLSKVEANRNDNGTR